MLPIDTVQRQARRDAESENYDSDQYKGIYRTVYIQTFFATYLGRKT